MAISQVVSDDAMMAIVEKRAAKDTSDALWEMRVDEDRMKKVCEQMLKQQLNKLHMEDSNTLNEYSINCTALLGEIRSLGMKLNDSDIVEKLFSLTPNWFRQIIGIIEQLAILKICTPRKQLVVS